MLCFRYGVRNVLFLYRVLRKAVSVNFTMQSCGKLFLQFYKISRYRGLRALHQTHFLGAIQVPNIVAVLHE